jgi:phosphoglycerol transferase MdoB-like AlkP superfamily enzyme
MIKNSIRSQISAAIKLISGLFFIGVLSLFLSKLVFFVTNANLFQVPTLMNIIGGVRFDMAIVSLLVLPLCIFILLPFPKTKWLKVSVLVLWYLGIISALTLNYIDVQYFRFTGKRLSIDLFMMKGLGNELPALVKAFFLDFWYLIIFFGLQIVLVVKMSAGLLKKHFTPAPFHWKLILGQFALLPLFAAIFIVVFRGVGLKPINTLAALSYGKAEQAALILNSPFTVIKSAESTQLNHNQLYTASERNELAPFQKNYYTDTLPTIKKNVVLLIVESLSEEYFELLDSNGNSFMPFLESLKDKSVRFEYNFANGKRSIDAVPALLASIPSWPSSPYITSSYNTNKIQSLPQVLKKHGYTSSFFHGGKNGTMGFDEFCLAAGVDAYYGLNEYPHPEDFDGTWGISDMPYLQYVAQKIKAEKEPAFHSIFTLSSHHPFKIPKPYITKLPKHSLEIMQSINYADLSLKAFFENLSDWDDFDNTLFIITGDHTSINHSPEWAQPTNTFKVPIWLYSTGLKAKCYPSTINHIDVFPTVVDYLNLPDTIFSVGNSAFDQLPYSIQSLSNRFYLNKQDTVMSFVYPNFDEPYEAFVYDKSQQKKTISKDSLFFNSDYIKASVDQYYTRLTQNKLSQP